MKTTGYEKQRVIVMLCITVDKNKLPPYIIPNRNIISKESFLSDFVIRVQEKVWMKSELMEYWMRVIWDTRPGSLRFHRTLLLRVYY